MRGYTLASILSEFDQPYKSLLDITDINLLPSDFANHTNKFLIVFVNGHWIALYNSDTHGIELFDSLGLTERSGALYRKVIPKNYQHILTNVTQFQPFSKSSCGKFRFTITEFQLL